MNPLSTYDWLKSVLKKQMNMVEAELTALKTVMNNGDIEGMKVHQKQVDYWMSRIRNTMRIIEEYEEEFFIDDEGV